MHTLVAGTEELVRLLSISFVICRGNSSIERLVAQKENRKSKQLFRVFLRWYFVRWAEFKHFQETVFSTNSR